EQGYFFSEVTPLCTVTPPTKTTVDNGTNETCQNLNPTELNDHEVKVVYDVTLNRRLKLTDIRITGTNKLTFADVQPELKSKKASAFAFIPFLGGYGRGFTSNALLQEDLRTIRAHMTDFGYRRAEVHVLQGISPTQDNLIITFNVDEGPLTRIAEIDLQGETAFTKDRLSKEVTIVKDAPYSRSQVRADNDRLLNLYAREGYIEAEVRPSVDDLPKKGEDEQVRIVFNVIKEGAKAIVNDIIINGVTGSASVQSAKRDAIKRAIPLSPGDLLRASQRQQLLRFEFLDPRFFRYGKRQFAPLAISAQYLRDSTITRFFRSTIDRGTFGVVQRLDAKGNPIDVLGNRVGQPTIDRVGFNIETQRDLSQKSHSIVFFRYSYEDVRLRNINSLLIKDILQPDEIVRLSRFGTSFVYDTRQRCERRLPGSFPGEQETISRAGEVCRYNQLDATRGQYLSADYSFAARSLGGNTSFSKFLSTYHTYYKFDQLRHTVFAG